MSGTGPTTLKLDTRIPDLKTIPTVYERFPAPEIIVDGIAGLGFSMPNLKITLFSERAPINPSTEPNERVVVGRLVMSIQTAHFLALTLRSSLDRMVAEKHIPPLPQVEIS